VNKRYIFTVCAGRSGQSSFTHLLQNSVPNCHVAFEAPHANVRFEGRLGNWERRFHRRFIETNELLGRGRVLTAFENSDEEYLARIARKRLDLIHRDMVQSGNNIYFDVSKFYARGLHVGFDRILDSYSLVLLVRDPVKNMRSFLNRNKNFFLDNNQPDSASNILRMDTASLAKGELYLWAWCELYLRFLEMANRTEVDKSIILRTSNLENADCMAKSLDELELGHGPVVTTSPRNTNKSLGFEATKESEEDIRLFTGFLDKLPTDLRKSIDYFDDYVPGHPA
jgi:hypothetical protein